MVHCVQCGTDLVAPVRSEYWSNNHACHIWHCPKCCACFSSLVSFLTMPTLSHRAPIILGFAQPLRELGDICRNRRLVFGERFRRRPPLWLVNHCLIIEVSWQTNVVNCFCAGLLLKTTSTSLS
jgi:hypothetical protein